MFLGGLNKLELLLRPSRGNGAIPNPFFSSDFSFSSDSVYEDSATLFFVDLPSSYCIFLTSKFLKGYARKPENFKIGVSMEHGFFMFKCNFMSNS